MELDIMVDPLDLELKFKKVKSGGYVCYAKECPEVIGQGKDQDQAASHFWREFDRVCAQIELFNGKTA